ncbi:hypothetical protein K488DRAFT_75359 [Vararia minispora EC-137]|uniref:Uncharacterized protein n=1 Tax=Vararia minispora EC-137 TaxID=1314806 RepID=A0ACB8Q3Y5_9AGAM|nr:hypothetical protein K488DRAFT_75359 [Vararia minispora EC-137]
MYARVAPRVTGVAIQLCQRTLKYARTTAPGSSHIPGLAGYMNGQSDKSVGTPWRCASMGQTSRRARTRRGNGHMGPYMGTMLEVGVWVIDTPAYKGHWQDLAMHPGYGFSASEKSALGCRVGEHTGSQERTEGQDGLRGWDSLWGRDREADGSMRRGKERISKVSGKKRMTCLVIMCVWAYVHAGRHTSGQMRVDEWCEPGDLSVWEQRGVRERGGQRVKKEGSGRTLRWLTYPHTGTTAGAPVRPSIHLHPQYLLPPCPPHSSRSSLPRTHLPEPIP